MAAAARSSCAAKVTSASLLQRLSLRFISWGSASSPCPPSLPHVSPAICPGEGGVGFGRKKEGLSPKQRVPAPPCSRSLYQRQPPPAPRYTRAPTIARGAAPLREVRAEALPDVVGAGLPAAALARSAPSGPSAAFSEETRPRWWVRAGEPAALIGLHPPRGRPAGAGTAAAAEDGPVSSLGRRGLPSPASCRGRSCPGRVRPQNGGSLLPQGRARRRR